MYTFHIIRDSDKGYGKEEYNGALKVDDIARTSRTVVLPEAISIHEPSAYKKHEGSHARLRALPNIALGVVSRVPDIEHAPFSGKRVGVSMEENEKEPTPLQEEITSTLAYRRRTFREGADVESINEKIDEMIDAYPKDILRILKEKGESQIKLSIYVGRKSYDMKTRRKIMYDKAQIFPLSDKGEIIRIAQQELGSGAEKVIVIPYGVRVPVELENLAKRKSPIPHTRRGDSRTIIVTGDVPNEIAVIRKRITMGEQVSQKDVEEFSEYTNIEMEELEKIVQENQRKAGGKNIMSVDAENLSGTRQGSGDPHVYRKVDKKTKKAA